MRIHTHKHSCSNKRSITYSKGYLYTDLIRARFPHQQWREPSGLWLEGREVGGRRDPRADAAQLRPGLMFLWGFHSMSWVSMVFTQLFFHGIFMGL